MLAETLTGEIHLSLVPFFKDTMYETTRSVQSAGSKDVQMSQARNQSQIQRDLSKEF